MYICGNLRNRHALISIWAYFISPLCSHSYFIALKSFWPSVPSLLFPSNCFDAILAATGQIALILCPVQLVAVVVYESKEHIWKKLARTIHIHIHVLYYKYISSSIYWICIGLDLGVSTRGMCTVIYKHSACCDKPKVTSISEFHKMNEAQHKPDASKGTNKNIIEETIFVVQFIYRICQICTSKWLKSQYLAWIKSTNYTPRSTKRLPTCHNQHEVKLFPTLDTEDRLRSRVDFIFIDKESLGVSLGLHNASSVPWCLLSSM